MIHLYTTKRKLVLFSVLVVTFIAATRTYQWAQLPEGIRYNAESLGGMGAFYGAMLLLLLGIYALDTASTKYVRQYSYT